MFCLWYSCFFTLDANSSIRLRGIQPCQGLCLKLRTGNLPTDSNGLDHVGQSLPHEVFQFRKGLFWFTLSGQAPSQREDKVETGDNSIFYQFPCQFLSFQGACPCHLYTLPLAFKCLKFLIFLCDVPLSHSQYQQGSSPHLLFFFLSSLPTQWVTELSSSSKINFALIEFFQVHLLN